MSQVVLILAEASFLLGAAIIRLIDGGNLLLLMAVRCIAGQRPIPLLRFRVTLKGGPGAMQVPFNFCKVNLAVAEGFWKGWKRGAGALRKKHERMPIETMAKARDEAACSVAAGR